jgi:DNA-binding winged helix-turn-helix (wHTH) protein
VRYRFAPFTVDAASRQLFRGADVLHLSPKAFDVLRLLLERRPAALSKAELLDLVWPGTFVAQASLTMAVAEIRRVLGDTAHEPQFVRTVHRYGYAFCGTVEDASPGANGAASASPPAWLVYGARTLVLREGDNVIGRDPGCDIWIDAAGVSRRHARIVMSRGAATVEDLGSKNGTVVQDAAVRSAVPLRDGDVIQLGTVDAQFRLWSERRTTETVRVVREGRHEPDES